MTALRTSGYVGIVGVIVFAGAVLILHLVQPGLDPRDEAVSYYVHGPFGWVLTVGLILLGIGSMSLVFGLARLVEGRWGRAGRWLVGVWGLGVLLGGVFPTVVQIHARSLANVSSSVPPVASAATQCSSPRRAERP